MAEVGAGLVPGRAPPTRPGVLARRFVERFEAHVSGALRAYRPLRDHRGLTRVRTVGMTPGDEHGGAPRPVVEQPRGGGSARPRGAPPRLRARFRRRFLVDVGMLALGVAVAGLYDGSIAASTACPGPSSSSSLTFVNLGARGALRRPPAHRAARRALAHRRGHVDERDPRRRRARRWPTASTAPRRRPCGCGSGRRSCSAAGRLATSRSSAAASGRASASSPTLIIGADARRAPDRRAACSTSPSSACARSASSTRSSCRARTATTDELPVLGSSGDLEAIVARARRPAGHRRLRGRAAAPCCTATVRRCRRLGRASLDGPAAYEEVNRRVEVEHLGGIPLVCARGRPTRTAGSSRSSTRSTASSPRSLLVCSRRCWSRSPLAVRLSSPGPVLYRQPRVEPRRPRVRRC